MASPSQIKKSGTWLLQCGKHTLKRDPLTFPYCFRNGLCPVFWFFCSGNFKTVFLLYFFLKMPSGESVTPKIVKAIFGLPVAGRTWKNIGLVFEETEDWARWIAIRYSNFYRFFSFQFTFPYFLCIAGVFPVILNWLSTWRYSFLFNALLFVLPVILVFFNNSIWCSRSLFWSVVIFSLWGFCYKFIFNAPGLSRSVKKCIFNMINYCTARRVPWNELGSPTTWGEPEFELSTVVRARVALTKCSG